MTDATDRDAALAALIALLDPAAFPHDHYVAALDRAGGSVERAAEVLLLGEGSSGAQGPVPEGKGKRKRRIEHWFFAPAKRAQSHGASGSGVGSSVAGGSGSASRPIARNSPPEYSTPVDRAAAASQWASLLRPLAPTSETRPRAAPQPPLHLASPAAVAAAGLPLALPASPLSPRMAAALFHELFAESPRWQRNRWFLAGREVESNHQATSYAQPGGGFGAGVGVHGYFYASRRLEDKPYTPVLAEAARLVEEVVNAHLDRTPRYPGEYRGRWRANMCAANRYDGAQSTVGFHSDQMTYLGPYPTIASLSLGTPRAFRLREIEARDEAFATGRAARTYEVTLGHNSLCLMTPGCQERYKHTVPPQRALDTFRPAWDVEGNPVAPGEGPAYTTRINITFRFYRDDFNPAPALGPYGSRSGTPVCKCGIPTILRADQKAKARSRSRIAGVSGNGGSSSSNVRRSWRGQPVLDDDMAHFWQCQSPSKTGELNGCGFFKILDMRGEGRGPCVGYDNDGVGDGGGDREGKREGGEDDEWAEQDASALAKYHPEPEGGANGGSEDGKSAAADGAETWGQIQEAAAPVRCSQVGSG